MDNELIQAIRSVMQEELQPIIKRLDTLEKGQERLEKGQTDLDKGLERLEKQQANFEKQQANFEKRQTGFEGVLAALDKRQDSMEGSISTIKEEIVNIKSQQQENTDLINALLHNVNVANAKIDGLTVSTLSKDVAANLASKADVAVIDTKLDLLNARLFKQEADLQLIKKAQ